MKLEYSTPKYEKLVKDNSSETLERILYPVGIAIETYLEPEKRDPSLPAVKERSRVYFEINGAYGLSVQHLCLAQKLEDAAGYLYLYVQSYLKGEELSRQEMNCENSVEWDSLWSKANLVLVFDLISLNETEQAKLIFQDKNDPMYHILNDDYDKALSLVEQLEDSPDEKKEISYKKTPFLKGIYKAMLTGDEKGFNEELKKRVKKYRRYTYDYSIVLDTCSAAMIKLAKKFGISHDFSIAEIPEYFLDENVRVDKGKYKLPDIPLHKD